MQMPLSVEGASAMAGLAASLVPCQTGSLQFAVCSLHDRRATWRASHRLLGGDLMQLGSMLWPQSG